MLGLVWAQSADGFIGRDGTMPWHVPEDLAHFRDVTGRSPVLMGRATWESLPERFRPLPGRANVVLSRRPGLRLDGATVVASVPDALALVAGGDAWVIGGAAVYAATLPHADRLEVTDLDLVVAGDTRAPVVPSGWVVVSTEPATGWATSCTGVRYRFRTLVRSAAGEPERAGRTGAVAAGDRTPDASAVARR